MLVLDDLLVARDFSPVSDRALQHALDVAACAEATLHVLTADVLHRDVTKEQEHTSPAAELDQIREKVKRDGNASEKEIEEVSVEEATRRNVGPAPAILNYASEYDIDLIVLGTRGEKGMKRVLLGSVTEEVVRRAERPVLSVRGRVDDHLPELKPIRRILAPLDFSEHSREALFYAREWAELYDARVDVLHVIPEVLHPVFRVGGVESVHEVEPNVEEKALKKVDTFMSETSGPAVETEAHVTSGETTSEILQFVDEYDVDLVTLSTHGRTGIEHFFLGSVAEKVVRHVDSPVLAVKAFGKSLVRSEPSGDGEAER